MNERVREGFVDAQPIPLADPAAPPAVENEPPKETWPVAVKLVHKPVRGPEGTDVWILNFRQPTGSDINRYGMPITITPDGLPQINERKMSMMMSALSGIHPPMLDRIDGRDWMAAAMRVQLFFIPDLEAAWSGMN